MTALIDGDLVAYRCAASAENDREEVALYRVDVNVNTILECCDVTEYKMYLTSPINFRRIINSTYKAQRSSIKPQFLDACKEYLVNRYHATSQLGYEADDLLGINQTDDTIICSLDKDLLQIPGLHFNWVKQQYNEFTGVSDEDGYTHFFRQMLIGDSVDNIKGIYKVGKITAGKLLKPSQTAQEQFDIVYNMYNDPARFTLNAFCLWIYRKKGVTWAEELNLTLPEECQQELDKTLESMKYLNLDT